MTRVIVHVLVCLAHGPVTENQTPYQVRLLCECALCLDIYIFFGRGGGTRTRGESGRYFTPARARVCPTDAGWRLARCSGKVKRFASLGGAARLAGSRSRIAQGEDSFTPICCLLHALYVPHVIVVAGMPTRAQSPLTKDRRNRG